MSEDDTTGRPSSVKPTAPESESSPISVSSPPSEPLEIAARNPTGTSASAWARSTSAPSTAAESTTGSRVGHGEDGAEAAGGSRPRAGRDRLLVLAAGRAQVDVRVDEGGREHEARRVDDTMAVRLDVGSELRDDAVVHAHVEHGVHTAGGIDDTRAADDEVVLGCVLDVEHHATSISSAASTATGPCVSRS